MKKDSTWMRVAIHAVITTLVVPAQALAAPLNLSTAPAGGARSPAPNVMVSVDNSTSMGSSGLTALQAALDAMISIAPDGSIRIGWQTMGYPACTAGGYAMAPTCSNLVGVRVLDANTRTAFKTWVQGLELSGSTPGHRMLRNAGEYYRKPVDVNSAWASIPGVTEQPVLGCRRAFNLFMTDGDWNEAYTPDSLGDVDGTARTLPDGEPYSTTAADTRIYRASYVNVNAPPPGSPPGTPGSQRLGGVPLNMTTSLADMAFHYWATDLQSGITNAVPSRISQKGPVMVTSGASSVQIPEYWNPRNDPATWQHMTTYMVGFNAASNWAGAPVFGADTWTGGDYDKLVTGLTDWPDFFDPASSQGRMADLWHASINSRGKFIPAPDATSLTAAFQEVLADVAKSYGGGTSSLGQSASTSSASSNSMLFEAGYDGSKWSGFLRGYTVQGGASPTLVKPAAWDSATVMDANPVSWPASRLVLSATSQGAANGVAGSGISWEWANLAPSQKKSLKAINGAFDSLTSDAVAQERMAYLRGDRSLEATAPAALVPYRERQSRLGDIVNSKVWYVPSKPSSNYRHDDYYVFRNGSIASRPAMVYVGANDGMLHGFDAATGAERIAYIPNGLSDTPTAPRVTPPATPVITPSLADLGNPAYSHAYYVDGSPLSGDVFLGSPATWRTYLAGFLGAGGKGYFVLDVTDPARFSVATAASTVVLDATSRTGMDPDIGHITSAPATEAREPLISRQITRMNNGRWALVTGNGVNSTNERAVLLVQYLDQAKELVKITAGGGTLAPTGTGNGLSVPRLIDLNGDGAADVAYAGDLLGNMWKFELNSATPADWKVAFNDTPLFQASVGGTPATSQPITTAPAWRPHPDGGLMLVFATGRNLTVADTTDTQQQTIYGIYDRTTVNGTPGIATSLGTVVLGTGSTVAGRTALQMQSVSSAVTGNANGTGNNFWTVSGTKVDYKGVSGPAKSGWYLDLPVSKERALKNPSWFAGDLVDILSVVPQAGASGETCDPVVPDAVNYVTTIDAINGARPNSQIYGYTRTGAAVEGENASRYVGAEGIGLTQGETEFKRCLNASECVSERKFPGWSRKLPSWRQLQ